MTSVINVAGVLARLHGWRGSLSAVLFMVPLLCALPAYIVFQNWLESTTLKAEWTLKGPTCPMVAKPSPVATRRHRPPMTHWYGDVRFTRSFGAVSCGSVPENPLWPSKSYRVCRFNNPGAVQVFTQGRTVIFEPGPGQPATVTVRRGQASCVIAGGFQY
jgi:hypothetical protein